MAASSRFSYLTRNIWLLSWVSFFTDVASEMLYPIMPLFLESTGFSMVGIGLLEGIAEAVAGLSKSYFGSWSDSIGKRMRFVTGGYLLSALSKPILAFLHFPAWIFLARSMDRLGKGIRTASRDAMLSDEASHQTKGRVMGFHRSVDTLGAFVGPLLALIYLHFFPGDYRNLFLIAFFPGIAAVLLTMVVKEKKQEGSAKKISLFSFLRYWKDAPTRFRIFVVAMMMFTFVNCSDFFILMKMKDNGASPGWVILAYVFFNLIYAVAAFPAGVLADRLGLKNILALGLLFFSAGFTTVAFSDSTFGFFLAFFFMGLFAASTEGISRAMISNMVPKSETATAIGFFTGWQSIMLLGASAFAGLLWEWSGSSVPVFIGGACVSAIVSGFFFFNFRGEAAQNA